MLRWVTRSMCGCLFISVCSGRRYVEMCNVVDVRVCSFRCAAGGGMWRWVTWAMCRCVHFGVQLEEVCGDG